MKRILLLVFLLCLPLVLGNTAESGTTWVADDGTTLTVNRDLTFTEFVIGSDFVSVSEGVFERSDGTVCGFDLLNITSSFTLSSLTESYSGGTGVDCGEGQAGGGGTSTGSSYEVSIESDNVGSPGETISAVVTIDHEGTVVPVGQGTLRYSLLDDNKQEVASGSVLVEEGDSETTIELEIPDDADTGEWTWRVEWDHSVKPSTVVEEEFVIGTPSLFSFNTSEVDVSNIPWKPLLFFIPAIVALLVLLILLGAWRKR